MSELTAGPDGSATSRSTCTVKLVLTSVVPSNNVVGRYNAILSRMHESRLFALYHPQTEPSHGCIQASHREDDNYVRVAGAKFGRTADSLMCPPWDTTSAKVPHLYRRRPSGRNCACLKTQLSGGGRPEARDEVRLTLQLTPSKKVTPIMVSARRTAAAGSSTRRRQRRIATNGAQRKRRTRQTWDVVGWSCARIDGSGRTFNRQAVEVLGAPRASEKLD